MADVSSGTGTTASGAAPSAATSAPVSPGAGSPAVDTKAAAGAGAAPSPATTTTGAPAPATESRSGETTAAAGAAAASSEKPGEQKSPTGEQKDPKTATGEPQKDASPAAPYDFKLPDGVTVSDEKTFGLLKEAMQKAGISTDNAPEFTKFIAEQKDALMSGLKEEQTNAWKTTNEGWTKQVLQDFKVADVEAFKKLPSYQNFGNLLSEFGNDNPELKAALDYTGAGNHPAIVKFLFKVADAYKEGGFAISGKPGGGKPKSKSGTLYDNKGV